MTRDEAERLARIFETVDGGCSYCIRDICDEANAAELGFYWKPVEEDGYRVEVVTDRPESGA